MKNSGLRSQRLDFLAVAGWCVLVLTGQCILNSESRALEWFSAIWLWCAALAVRRTWCLPLLIVTYPAFMCENSREWAWVQAVAGLVLLLRILFESFLSRRRFLVLLLAGAVIVFLSWPSDAGELLVKLRKYPLRELFRQFLAPHAVWAMFPFRQVFDRTLVGVLCAVFVIDGTYFSGPRIWKALWLCGLLCVCEAYAGAIFPWQEAHTFLGTTNHGTYKWFLFHGAGYSIHFFSIMTVTVAAYFFVPRTIKERYLKPGTAILLLPSIVFRQRSVRWTVIALGILGCVVLMASAVKRIRGRPLCDRRGKRGYRPAVAVSLCAGLFFAGLWFYEMGVLNPDSELRSQLGKRYGRLMAPMLRGGDIRTIDEQTSSGGARNTGSKHRETAKKDRNRTVGRDIALEDKGGGSAAGADSSPGRQGDVSGYARLKVKIKDALLTRDKTRGHMWILAIRSMKNKHFWRGMGAGTWARFHKRQDRPYGPYFAHSHNTYVDLMFEHGALPVFVLFAILGVGFVRILFGWCFESRLWLFYLVGLGTMALGQHLLFAFSTTALAMPAFVVLARASGMKRNRNEARLREK